MVEDCVMESGLGLDPDSETRHHLGRENPCWRRRKEDEQATTSFKSEVDKDNTVIIRSSRGENRNKSQ